MCSLADIIIPELKSAIKRIQVLRIELPEEEIVGFMAEAVEKEARCLPQLQLLTSSCISEPHLQMLMMKHGVRSFSKAITWKMITDIGAHMGTEGPCFGGGGLRGGDVFDLLGYTLFLKFGESFFQ